MHFLFLLNRSKAGVFRNRRVYRSSRPLEIRLAAGRSVHTEIPP